VPLQNRVTPTGEIVAVHARGLLMGNRGCLHDEDRRLNVARWRSAMWITCTLVWKDWRRDVMPPGRWTALFFLDEATAFAAGHRPCGYCRWADFLQYAENWGKVYGLEGRGRAPKIDRQLHRERVESRTRRQRTWSAKRGSLPDGVMVAHDDHPALVLGEAVRRWTFDGYGPPIRVPRDETVEVLTPPSTVRVIEAGYRPLLHPSAVDGAGALIRVDATPSGK
jgi:hypothetical protein